MRTPSSKVQDMAKVQAMTKAVAANKKALKVQKKQAMEHAKALAESTVDMGNDMELILPNNPDPSDARQYVCEEEGCFYKAKFPSDFRRHR
jgi:hypothetical protein